MDRYLPLSIVDSDSFRLFVSSLDPLWTPPCRQTFTDLIVRSTVEMTTKLESLLSTQTNTMAITSDGWSDSAQNSYLSITAHFFDKTSLTLQNRTLGMIYCPESHTATVIEKKIRVHFY